MLPDDSDRGVVLVVAIWVPTSFFSSLSSALFLFLFLFFFFLLSFLFWRSTKKRPPSLQLKVYVKNLF